MVLITSRTPALRRISRRRNICIIIGFIGALSFLWFFVSQVLLSAHQQINKDPQLHNPTITFVDQQKQGIL